jgi:CarD family transcriptional regulator
MKYNINGKVVDPIHGAGVITEISDQMVSGEICECVVIEIVVGKKRVMVPTESLHDAELRPVVSSEELDGALQELFLEPDELPKDWRRRIEKLKDRVHSGEPKEVAKAIRDIIARSVLNKMNPSEKRVLNEAINVFAGEVALVRNIRSDSARDLIKRSAREGVQQNIKSGETAKKIEGARSDAESTESEEEASESPKGSEAGKSRKKSSGKK